MSNRQPSREWPSSPSERLLVPLPLFLFAILLSCFAILQASGNPQEPPTGKNLPDTKGTTPMPAPATALQTELATLGNGCFWCTEAVFQQLRGVIRVKSGYSGGKSKSPTYEQVCTGTTGHAEAVQVEFDPSVISYETILDVFWTSHDPTTLNRQGHDVGTQYRSVVFYHSDAQRLTAEASKKKLDESKELGAPVVTEISPYSAFYPAENYHDDYYRLNGRQPYCSAVIRPKVEKIQKLFKGQLK